MTKLFPALMLTSFALLAATRVMADSCPLLGTWVSQEELTLNSMNETGNVTAKQRDLFEGSFFGKLKFIVSCEEITTVYEGESSTQPYKLLYADDRRATVTLLGESQEEIEYTATFVEEGRCYSVPVSGLGFSEFFCKVE